MVIYGLDVPKAYQYLIVHYHVLHRCRSADSEVVGMV